MEVTLNSGRKMPLVALGTDKFFGEECRAMLQRAFDIGYRHIDTAAMYRNEADIGQFVTTTDRQQLFLTSKCWVTQYREVREACLGSLERLQTSYLDLYLLHWPFAFKSTQRARDLPDISHQELDRYPLHEVWNQMESLVEEGLVKDIGVSNWPVGLLNDMLAYAQIPPAVNQFETHIYNARKDLMEFCIGNGVVPMGYRLIFRPWDPARHAFTQCALDNEVAAEIAAKYNRPVSEILLKWQLHRGGGCVVRSGNPDRLQSNWNSQFLTLNESDQERLSAMSVDGFIDNGVAKYGIPIFS